MIRELVTAVDRGRSAGRRRADMSRQSGRARHRARARGRCQDHAAGRTQGISSDRCRSAARNWCSPSTTAPGRPPRRRCSTRSRPNACWRPSSCSAAMPRPHPADSPGASWPKVTRSAITRFRIRCSTIVPLGQSRSRHRPRHRGRRIRALWRAAQRADHAVLPLSRLCLQSGACSTAWLQRGLVVFGADVWASDWLPMTPDSRTPAYPGPHRQGRPRHRAVSRHQKADRADAAGLPARAQAARLPHRARGCGRAAAQTEKAVHLLRRRQ